MSQATLKLVEPADTDALTFERRGSSRYVIAGRFTAVRGSDTEGHGAKRICSLELMNISDGGLGAVSKDPIDIDARITVFFPPHGPERGFDMCGRVVRCSQLDRGHEVGIRFDERHAA